MAHTTTYQPSRTHRLSSRFPAIAVVVALLMAAVITISLLVAAARDTSESTPSPVATVEPQGPAAAVAQDTCVPARVVTPC